MGADSDLMNGLDDTGEMANEPTSDALDIVELCPYCSMDAYVIENFGNGRVMFGCDCGREFVVVYDGGAVEDEV